MSALDRLPTAARIFFFLALVFLVSVSPCFSTIHYDISLKGQAEHVFRVTVSVPDVSGSLCLQMPAWNALYEIRDFSSHVMEVSAANKSGQLPIEKLDKQTWQVTGSGEITVSYATFWDEPGPFASQLDLEHAFINPALILMYVPGRRGEEVVLSVSNVPGGWRLASPQLESEKDAVFAANNYDQLADSPIEASNFTKVRLADIAPPIDVVLHGKIEKRQEFETKLARICRYEISLMGRAPFSRYLFIFHVGEHAGYGGMEHANGTAIAAGTENGLLGVSAHEFFHLWNVKRIRPASLEPVDYTKEQYTRSLWFAEGVTSTYERYAMVRAGVWPKHVFYTTLARQIAELESHPANAWQSAEQSSLDTWFEKYPIYGNPDHSVSYYAKGSILGLLLDLWIREQSNNTQSLDDMMRAMNEQFGKTGKPYRDREDLESVCSQVASRSCKDFFEKYVGGTTAFPYEAFFAFAGLKIRRVVQTSPATGTQISYEISEDDAASERQKRIRDGILRGITDKAGGPGH